MLGKTGGCGISIGICPCSEVVSAASFNDCGLNLGKNLIKITSLGSQIDTKSAWIAHQRGRKVCFDEVAAVFHKLL